jgi:hypothetical protein
MGQSRHRVVLTGISAFGLIHSIAQHAVMITFSDAKGHTLGGQDHDQRRLLGFGLMLGRIALLGAVTATLASWLIECVEAEEEPAEDLQATVRRLAAAKLDLLCDRAETRPDGHRTAGSIQPAKLGANSVSPIPKDVVMEVELQDDFVRSRLLYSS